MGRAIRAVLFDLDNTLADRDAAFLSWARWFAGDALNLTDADAIEQAVATLINLDANGYTPRDAFLRAVYEQFPQVRDDKDDAVAAFRAQLVSHLPPLDHGAITLLTALEEAGMPWGLVTNGSSDSQRRKITALGLGDRANCVLISGEINVRKPDPAIFRVAAERLGVPEGEVLFVGDHPDNDIVGAAAVGMQTAWVCRGSVWPDQRVTIVPDHVVTSLHELVDVAAFPSRPLNRPVRRSSA